MWRGIKPQRCGWRYLERLAGEPLTWTARTSMPRSMTRSNSFAAAGLPEGKPPPQPWHENIKPICWPEHVGQVRAAAPVRGEGLDSLWLRDLALRLRRHRQVAAGPAAGHRRRRWAGIGSASRRSGAGCWRCSARTTSRSCGAGRSGSTTTLGVTMADLGDFLPDARTGEENVLAHGRDVLQTTELYDQIAAAIAELKPGLVILDNIAQMFARQRERPGARHPVRQSPRPAGAGRRLRRGAAGARRQGRGLGVLGLDGLGCGGAVAAAAGLRGPGRRQAPAGSASPRPTTRRPTRSSWSGATACCTPSTSSTTRPPGKLERGLRDGQANQVFLDALDTLRARGMAASESKQATTSRPS